MTIDCQDVHAALRRGPLPEEPALTEHVADCSACEALVSGGVPLAEALDDSAPMPGFDELLAQVEAAVDQERGPVAWLRSRSTPVRALLVALGAALVPGLVWLTWTRVDIHAYPPQRWALDLAVLVLPLALVLAVVLRPLYRPAWPRWVEPALLAVTIAAVLIGPMLGGAHHDHPASLAGTGPHLLPRAGVCLGLGTLMGLPILAWLTVLGRQERGWSRPTSLAAVAAGVTAVFAIFLHCPIVAPEHLLLGHASVLVPFVLLGLMGLRR